MEKGRVASLFCLILLGTISLLVAEEPLREWTDAEGRKVRAQLAGFHDSDTVILKLEDGRSVNFPIAKLSAADGAYAREHSNSAGSAKSTVDWSQPVQSTEFVIRGVKRETVPGYIAVKSGWERRIRCAEARLEYKGPKDAAEASVKAYYYDRDGRLIEQFDRVPRRQDEGRTYVTVPEFFPKGDTVEVYYPITDFHESSNLATVLIVFGSGDQYSAATLPTTSLEHLAFEEKRHLFPGWDPAESEKTDTTAPAPGLDLEIRRVRHEKHRYSVVFDGNYQNGKAVVAAEVRALGSPRPGDGRVTLYAYDAEGKRVGFRPRPSTASIGGGTYVGVPKIANDDWHPVFFALDGDLTEEPPTYVVVFQFGGKTTAAVVSSKGATLESLDFPEKGEIAKGGD